MKNTLCAASALSLLASGATAAGLDRSNQDISSIFNELGTASLGFAFIEPSVTGKDAQGNSYDVGESYAYAAFTWNYAINEAFSYAVIVDEPYGVDVDYNNDPTTSALGGTGAQLDSNALTLIGRYKMPSSGLSFHGGLSLQRITADVLLNGLNYQVGISSSLLSRDFNRANPLTPDVTTEQLAAVTIGSQPGATPEEQAAAAAAQGQIIGDGNAAVLGQIAPTNGAFIAGDGYEFDMDESVAVQPLIGMAYEIPDIALRFSATYFFETDHSADTEENVLGQTVDSDIDFVAPQALNLDFQTGIATDTLLTASYRWVQYSAVDLVPDRLGSDLVNLDDGRRWTLGVARRFTPEWAGNINFIYEPEGEDDLVSPLGPTNGLVGVTLGVRYENEGLTALAGVNYSQLGDARAEVGGIEAARFEDNYSRGVGFRISYEF